MRKSVRKRNGFCRINGGKKAAHFLLIVAPLIATSSVAQAQSGPLRGIHLPNRWNFTTGLTQGDRQTLRQYAPGMVVVMSRHISPGTVEYLRDDLLGSNPSAEIFVRWMPSNGTSSCPPAGTTSRAETGSRYYSRNYTTDNVTAMSASDVVDAIIADHDVYKNMYGLELQRWIPGNEPELEWNYSVLDQFQPEKWHDINAYYTDIWHYMSERKGDRNIELYTPGFSQNGAVGVGYYHSNGQVTRQFLYGTSETVGLDLCQQLIDTYRNLTWHNYFHPGCAAQHSMYQFFPSWLKSRIEIDKYPPRITEAGWHPDSAADRDAFFSNGGDGWSGWYEQDMQWFIQNAAGAHGVAVWLLGSDDSNLERHKAAWRQFDDIHSPQGQLSKMRAWFYNLIHRVKGATGRYRDGQSGRRNLALNGQIAFSPNEYPGNPAWAAVDGIYGDLWNSGGFPTQSLSFRLENNGYYNVDQVRAKVAQTPSGTTTHKLWLWNGSAWDGPYIKTGHTENGQWLEWNFNPARRAGYVYLRTTSSPSWVAWSEVEVYGQ
jgi:hypothetical protein